MISTTVTIDKAGRFVIPKAVRDELELEAGDSLELVSDGDRLTLRPVRAGASLRREQGVWVFRRHAGTMSAESVTQVLESLRGARECETKDQSQQQRTAILEGIARGEKAVADGRVVSNEDAKARLGRWLK